MKKYLLLATVFVLYGCKIHFRKTNKDVIYHLATVNNNVCKKLKDKVVLYALFVDSKYTGIWTKYDIQSTLDSIRKAVDWIEEKAKKEGINLRIEVAYHQNKRTIPIQMKLPRKNLSASLFPPGSSVSKTRVSRGIKYIDRWADKVAKIALTAYKPDTSKIIKTKIIPKDRDKLIARLRDIYQTDNIALMYFINNYFSDEISVALHTGADNTPEYSVVSYKFPAVIAHEFLHLFGAEDLYVSPFDNKRKIKKRKKLVMKEFPNEIMAFPHRRISTLNISPFTKYLIGWHNQLDEKYKEIMLGKKIQVARY